jgi:hypothetical protein
LNTLTDRIHFKSHSSIDRKGGGGRGGEEKEENTVGNK